MTYKEKQEKLASMREEEILSRGKIATLTSQIAEQEKLIRANLPALAETDAHLFNLLSAYLSDPSNAQIVQQVHQHIDAIIATME